MNKLGGRDKRRYVSEARKRPAGARILARRAMKLLAEKVFHIVSLHEGFPWAVLREQVRAKQVGPPMFSLTLLI